MLTHLSIRNFAIVDSLDMELRQGMTAITGETGAGKSIMLDALALVLGARADSSVVPAGKPRAEVAVTLDLGAHRSARQWLAEQQLDRDGDNKQDNECLLRRVITKEGRSHAWINGQPVTLQQLKTLGSQVIDIHSQHEHQSLLLRETHRQLLDDAAGSVEIAGKVQDVHGEWKALADRLHTLRCRSDDNNARWQLLHYQVEELDNLALQDGELQSLEQEQRQLANAEQLQSVGQQLLGWCRDAQDEQGSLLDRLDQALVLLGNQKIRTASLTEAEKMLESARIQVEEACHEIDRHQSSMDIDPERLQEVEQRLSLVYQVARKHRIQPDTLVVFHRQLQAELQVLNGSDEDVSVLEQQLAAAYSRYQVLATELTALREQGAARLSRAVNRELKRLNMSGCQFRVEFTPRTEITHVHGNESVEFFASTNPGQPFMPLKKVASGGELSRISLAIQVVTAQTSVIPTLVFDEVDVGIGGETASVVGQLLRQLGDKAQVICVTHQAAVAARAHHHWFVMKNISRGKVATALVELGHQDRIDEVARMIGGEQTSASRAHAEDMLKAG